MDLPYKKLCSSSNKINSLGKPSNRWKDIYVNKAVLGDGDADSDVRLVADITGTETNPELKYNVTEQRWQVSHDGIGFGNIQSIHVSTTEPDNAIGANGDLWVVYSALPIEFVPPIRLQQDVTTYTLSEESASRRIIFTSPNPCTVTLPDTGLPIGFHCLIRNSGGGSLTVVPTGDAVIENTILKWSDPTKYGSVLLESTSPFYTYFLMGGLEE